MLEFSVLYKCSLNNCKDKIILSESAVLDYMAYCFVNLNICKAQCFFFGRHAVYNFKYMLPTKLFKMTKCSPPPINRNNCQPFVYTVENDANYSIKGERFFRTQIYKSLLPEIPPGRMINIRPE
jgi:hypothetical protein